MPRIIHIYPEHSRSELEELDYAIQKLAFLKKTICDTIEYLTILVNNEIKTNKLTVMPSMVELHNKYHRLHHFQLALMTAEKKLEGVELGLMLKSKERKRLLGEDK